MGRGSSVDADMVTFAGSTIVSGVRIGKSQGVAST